MNPAKRILVAPLDWGLGHAARCVPIIRYLTEKGAVPVLAASSRPLAFLKSEFPQLEIIDLPGYNIAYPSQGSMALKMLGSAPRILRGIRHEHHALQQIIRQHRIDAVISDNRFGLWTKQVPCVFITHQLMVKSPFGEGLLHLLNKNYIGKYNECWIPDTEGEENLSGDLAHKYKLPPNAHFIGPLSRFEGKENGNFAGGTNGDSENSLLVIISGPEPQRSIFERIITEQLVGTSLKTLVVEGRTEANDHHQKGNVTTISHLDTNDMLRAVRSSRLVISRPGYSTVMDLSALGKKAVFVPTPGQTEQEYLGKELMKKKIAFCVPQDKFILEEALKEAASYTGFSKAFAAGSYRKRVDSLLERL